jgi:hypothetical protein
MDERSFFWGTKRDQHVVELLTIFDTNVARGEDGAGILMAVRALCFMAMCWLTYEDLRTKGLKYAFFTTWGAYATLVAFFLLLMCSLLKY